MPVEKKISVLFLPRWYPYEEDPLFGLFVERHAGCLLTQAEVKVLFIHPIPGIAPGLHYRRSDKDGVDTLCIHYNNIPTRWCFPNLVCSIFSYLKATYRGYRLLYPAGSTPDICHVHVLTRPALLAYWLYIKHKTPFLITEHWSRYHKELNRYNGFLRKKVTSLISRKAFAVTAVSDHLRQSMQACGIDNKRFVLLANIVDTDIFSPGEPSAQNRRKLFIHISTFDDDSKNISGMLKAVASLSINRNDFTFRLVGDGPDFEKMKQLATDLGLQSPLVEFTGACTDQQVAGYLREAAFLLMFSNYENQPVVIIESFACGKPVLATRVGGIPEMVDSTRGILVEAGREDQLTPALSQMLDQYQHFDRNALREYAKQNFSREMVSAKLLALYREALHTKKQ